MAIQTLVGCTAVITGASSGIGRELALQLAHDAATLVLIARREERLNDIEREVSLINPDLKVVTCIADLSDPDQVQQLISALKEQNLPVNLLINNAGLGDFGHFAESSWDRCNAMLEVNMKALTRLTHAMLPEMVERGEGCVLNVSSTASYVPIPKMSVYAATKAYVTSFGEAVRAELDGTGVSVVTLCPGPVETEFHSVARRAEDGNYFQSPDWFRVPVGQVAAESLEAVVKDRPRVIPGLAVCVVISALSLVPIFLLRGALKRVARE